MPPGDTLFRPGVLPLIGHQHFISQRISVPFLSLLKVLHHCLFIRIKSGDLEDIAGSPSGNLWSYSEHRQLRVSSISFLFWLLAPVLRMRMGLTHMTRRLTYFL